MNLDIQWFISGLVENNILTVEQCQEIISRISEDCNLTSFAQEILNSMAAEMDEESAMALLEKLQSLMEMSSEQAASGNIPQMFAPPEEEQEEEEEEEGQEEEEEEVEEGDHTWDNLPVFDNVASMSDEEVANLMIASLKGLRALGASDLHISASAVPFIRRNLQIAKISDHIISPEDALRLNHVLLNKEQKDTFDQEMDLNFALEIEHDRFRVSLMMHKDGASGTYRLVPNKLRTLSDLGFLPQDVATVERLLDYHNGLILVTGPLGSGKTTTLATMVNTINKKRHDHVITVEDPIEILIPSQNCNITQREVGKHTNNYRSALKGALREDPDIIVIGELHDLDTIENAITASETGHLVIGTLHTCDAANTLNRLLDVFPPTQQPQIRAMTSVSLRGIICQRLIPSASGSLTVAYEMLINTMAVGNIISEGKTHHLKAVMQTGIKQGMTTFEANILNKYNAGQITPEVAEENIHDRAILKQLKESIAIGEAKKYAAEQATAKKK
jgi:twitching motility protein PilT